MNIQRIVVGALSENCYILKIGNNAVLVDPGDEPEKIEKELEGFQVIGILLTHSHFDHIKALAYFEKKYQIKHNEKIKDLDYEVIKTPGHSLDSQTFYFKKEQVMFTGDFLFQGSIGRMDLPGGNRDDMKKSLERINTYPDEITIYPGHGSKSTLGEEKKLFSYYIWNI